MLATILGLGVSISIFLSVLSYGLQAGKDDFLYLFRRPVQLIKAILSINVIMPVFVFLLVMLFKLESVVEVALVALAISPVPPILPNKALKGGGGKSFTFGLLAAISLLSIVLVPLVLKIFETVFDRSARFSEFSVIKTILMTVIVPLILGMVICYFAPAFSERIASPLGKIAMIILILSFLPILIALLPAMWSLIGSGTILAIAAFAIVGVTVGHFLGGPDPNDRVVLALATSSRHPAIAIALTAANVGEAETKLAAAAILLYVIVGGIVATPYLAWLTDDKTHIEEKAA
jgi:BASS family bile acid:Na+ symporter